MPPHPTASPLSRRRLLAVSGVTLAAGSSALLAACGTASDEDASPEENAELLNGVLAQQLAVLEAATQATRLAPEEASAAATALRGSRERSTAALANEIRQLDGTATDEPADQAAQAESPTEGLARQLEAAIAATQQALAELSPEHRPPVLRAIAEDAAALAVMRSALGEPVAPDAFVLGAAAEAPS